MKQLKLKKETLSALEGVNSGWNWFGSAVCMTNDGTICFACQSIFNNCNVVIAIGNSENCQAYSCNCPRYEDVPNKALNEEE